MSSFLIARGTNDKAPSVAGGALVSCRRRLVSARARNPRPAGAGRRGRAGRGGARIHGGWV